VSVELGRLKTSSISQSRKGLPFRYGVGVNRTRRDLPPRGGVNRVRRGSATSWGVSRARRDIPPRWELIGHEGVCHLVGS